MDAKQTPDFEIPPGVAQPLKSLSAAASGIYRAYDPKVLSTAAQAAARSMERIAEASRTAYVERFAELSSIVSDCLRNAIRVPDLSESIKPLLNALDLYRITESDSARLREAIDAAIRSALASLGDEPAEDTDAAEFLEVSEDFYDAAEPLLELARDEPNDDIQHAVQQIRERPRKLSKETIRWLISILVSIILFIIQAHMDSISEQKHYQQIEQLISIVSDSDTSSTESPAQNINDDSDLVENPGNQTIEPECTPPQNGDVD